MFLRSIKPQHEAATINALPTIFVFEAKTAEREYLVSVSEEDENQALLFYKKALASYFNHLNNSDEIDATAKREAEILVNKGVRSSLIATDTFFGYQVKSVMERIEDVSLIKNTMPEFTMVKHLNTKEAVKWFFSESLNSVCFRITDLTKKTKGDFYHTPKKVLLQQSIPLDGIPEVTRSSVVDHAQDSPRPF